MLYRCPTAVAFSPIRTNPPPAPPPLLLPLLGGLGATASAAAGAAPPSCCLCWGAAASCCRRCYTPPPPPRMQQLWGNFDDTQFIHLLTRALYSSEKHCRAIDFDPIETNPQTPSTTGLLTGLKCIWHLCYIGGVYGTLPNKTLTFGFF